MHKQHGHLHTGLQDVIQWDGHHQKAEPLAAAGNLGAVLATEGPQAVQSLPATLWDGGGLDWMDRAIDG